MASVDRATSAGWLSLACSLSKVKKGCAEVDLRDDIREVERDRTALNVELPRKKPDPGCREEWGERTPIFES
jgi:hypothetical protein